MNRKYLAAALLVLSLSVTAALIVSSHVSYAPSVTATEIQNIYLSRIVRLGATSAACQLAALIVIASGRRPA